MNMTINAMPRAARPVDIEVCWSGAVAVLSACSPDGQAWLAARAGLGTDAWTVHREAAASLAGAAAAAGLRCVAVEPVARAA